jgi:hypothetical protein
MIKPLTAMDNALRIISDELSFMQAHNLILKGEELEVRNILRAARRRRCTQVLKDPPGSPI